MSDLNLTLISRSKEWNTLPPGPLVTWLGMMLLAEDNGVLIGSTEWLSLRINIPPDELGQYIADLIDAGSITELERGWAIERFEEFEWKSSNAIRQKAYRERKKLARKGGSNVG